MSRKLAIKEMNFRSCTKFWFKRKKEKRIRVLGILLQEFATFLEYVRKLEMIEVDIQAMSYTKDYFKIYRVDY